MSIIVVGCGVFGLSTILALTGKGYNVIGLDAEEVPSHRSAAYDYNKMIRVEYADIEYAKLAVEALDSWKHDPLYKKYYKQTGRLVLSPYKQENKGRIEYDRRGAQNVKKLGVKQRIVELRSSAEVGKLIPEFKGNQLQNPLVARYNLDSGMGESSDSLVAVYRECVRRGVRFIFGGDGEIVNVEDGRVTAKSGKSYDAVKVIVCCGANSSSLVNMGKQVTAIGHFVSHVQLTDEQYAKYKDMPIFFSAEHGYFFPPDPQDHVIKVGHNFADARHWTANPFDSRQKVSIPRYVKGAPIGVEKATRELMQLLVPELAVRPIVRSGIAWTSRSFDAGFVIDYIPGSSNVMVCTGDSAHGYKFLPNIGKYIVARLEGTLDRRHRRMWRFRSPVLAGGTGVSSIAKRKWYDVNSVKHWTKL